MSQTELQTKYYVICVDDDREFLSSLAEPLQSALDRLDEHFQCQCEFVDSADAAAALGQRITAQADQCALIITDQRMPGTTGLELLEKMREIFPQAARALLTGYAGLDSARLAINKKLLDRYITKPIGDLAEFSATVVGLVNEYHLRRLAAQQQQTLQEQVILLGQANDHIARLKRAAEQVAYFTKDMASLDLQEVLYTTTTRIPRLFGATHGVLAEIDKDHHLHLLRRFGHGCKDFLACTKDLPTLMDQFEDNHQPCLIRPFAQATASDQGCGQTLQIVIPISCAWPDHYESQDSTPVELPQADKPNQLYPNQNPRPIALCLCCPQNSDQQQQLEEIRYKAALIREILGTNFAHAAAYAESQRLSRYDNMTGLFVRRVLEDRLTQACHESNRYGRTVSMAIMDVDNFKDINDTFGHLTGDAVLEELGQLIRDSLRSCDVAARFGGDEFAILLPDTPALGAQKLVERFRHKVAEHSFAYGHLKVTVSIGVATYDAVIDTDPVSLLHRADEAMYRAKGSGRNAVKCALGSQEQAKGQSLAGV